MLIVIGNGICIGYLLVRIGQGDSLLSDGKTDRWWGVSVMCILSVGWAQCHSPSLWPWEWVLRWTDNVLTHLHWKISVLGLNLCLHVGVHIFKKCPAKSVCQYGVMSCGWLLSLWNSPEQGVPLTPWQVIPGSMSFKTRDSSSQLYGETGWGHSQSFCIYCCVDRMVLMECFSPPHWLFWYCLFKMYI